MSSEANGFFIIVELELVPMVAGVVAMPEDGARDGGGDDDIDDCAQAPPVPSASKAATAVAVT
ncbi:MAG TPA: hypothetical protein VNF99_22485 [Stellaceae bacterium]|nr:hypothetical protein [Stellaceae bacterium]